MMGSDIGIDLGTSSILIYVNHKGTLLNEPTVVAVNKENNEIIAMGTPAKRMVGRTSERIEIVYPMSNGVISSCDLVESMLLYFLRKIKIHSIFMPRVVVCIPGVITDVERRAVVQAVHAAGVRKICLLEETVAAAIGAGEDIYAPHGIGVLDIGAGTSDMAVITVGGLAVSTSVRVAGNHFDQAIIQYCRKKYNILIGERTAEQVKIAIGCVAKRERNEEYCLKGRDITSGLPRKMIITSEEIREAILPSAMEIIRELQGMLEETSPELLVDIANDGLLLTGGGAYLYGMDQLIYQYTGLKVKIPENPEKCVVVGSGVALQKINSDETADGVINPLWQENDIMG